MPDRPEPISSLLVRELTILSKNFGQLSTSLWELSRVLLQVDVVYAKEANTYKDGKAAAPGSTPPESSSADPFSSPLFESHD